VGRPNTCRVDSAQSDGHAHRERYWAMTVLVQGSIPTIWAPYGFRIDGKTSHCAIDVFSFAPLPLPQERG